jgi:dihydroneopterin aldolase
MKIQKINIGFRNLHLVCSVGVLPHELEAAQEIVFTVEVTVENFDSDSLEDTVDYVALMECCKEVSKRGHFSLLEKLASEILKELHQKFPILRAKITLEKPGAFSNAASSFVTLEST